MPSATKRVCQVTRPSFCFWLCGMRRDKKLKMAYVCIVPLQRRYGFFFFSFYLFDLSNKLEVGEWRCWMHRCMGCMQDHAAN